MTQLPRGSTYLRELIANTNNIFSISFRFTSNFQLFINPFYFTISLNGCFRILLLLFTNRKQAKKHTSFVTKGNSHLEHPMLFKNKRYYIVLDYQMTVNN